MASLVQASLQRIGGVPETVMKPGTFSGAIPAETGFSVRHLVLWRHLPGRNRRDTQRMPLPVQKHFS